jgi:hypothetical protein
MRLICKGCGSTVDLYEGALEDCPLCDTTHNFKRRTTVLRDTYRDRNATDHVGNVDDETVESLGF